MSHVSITDVQVDEDDTETMRFNVTGLRPYSTYQLRVRAENIYGTSTPSTPSRKCAKISIQAQDEKHISVLESILL